ncbi:helix-turn-helix domain-containing protein [Methylobacterium sp. J-088]|uniref:helix-turn-helix transcriptional regulator n=1 Tax=Methylobacterium sp. J-088 TaxID=2836664 RepID=UPI001FBB813A|nr:helix-turn-helix transcriptional regulator [Methylobacterium sp. J-088]MCJ2063266.1 helix-turn-helix domain-containing protein [Methylobacterium sp. J-088]
MLVTGNQLKAARALSGIEQADLATRADLHVNTIRKMEAKGPAEITSGADVVRRVQCALEAAGVEFLNHGRPGVRLRGEPQT